MIKIEYKKFPAASVKQIPMNLTVFPDGTTQVWKLAEIPCGDVQVTWYYENESEVLQIMQLGLLLEREHQKAHLYVPYLPYARQDKEITNESCFAKVLLNKVFEHYKSVTTLDVHSDTWHIHPHIKNVEPTVYFERTLNHIHMDVTIVYPDEGAYFRYKDNTALQGRPYIILSKVRDQLTGKITSLEIKSITTDGTRVVPENYLIVDDISDYGGTFILAATALHKQLKVNTISLYVTHFLGHGGFERLSSAGITTVYTSDSLTHYRAKDNFLKYMDKELVVWESSTWN